MQNNSTDLFFQVQVFSYLEIHSAINLYLFQSTFLASYKAFLWTQQTVQAQNQFINLGPDKMLKSYNRPHLQQRLFI